MSPVGSSCTGTSVLERLPLAATAYPGVSHDGQTTRPLRHLPRKHRARATVLRPENAWLLSHRWVKSPL